LAARLNQGISNSQSPDEATNNVLRSLLRQIRQASGVNYKKNVYPAASGNDADAYWYEIQQTLVGFQEELVAYDYRAIVKEELLDKIPSASP
jgi:hypothetical protein